MDRCEDFALFSLAPLSPDVRVATKLRSWLQVVLGTVEYFQEGFKQLFRLGDTLSIGSIRELVGKALHKLTKSAYLLVSLGYYGAILLLYLLNQWLNHFKEGSSLKVDIRAHVVTHAYHAIVLDFDCFLHVRILLDGQTVLILFRLARKSLFEVSNQKLCLILEELVVLTQNHTILFLRLDKATVKVTKATLKMSFPIEH